MEDKMAERTFSVKESMDMAALAGTLLIAAVQDAGGELPVTWSPLLDGEQALVGQYTHNIGSYLVRMVKKDEVEHYEANGWEVVWFTQ
jgi:hypothetical protein